MDFTNILPDEISLLVLRFLPVRSLALANCVNRRWYGLSSDFLLWRDQCRAIAPCEVQALESSNARLIFSSFKVLMRALSETSVRMNEMISSSCLVVTEDDEVFRWDPQECDSVRSIPSLKGRGVCLTCCGMGHCVAVTMDGKLFTWGLGSSFRLGHGNVADRSEPTRVVALEGHRVVRCSASILCVEGGVCYTWGWGEHGRNGNGSSDNLPVPRPVEALKDFKIKSCSSVRAPHSLVATAEGKVYSWGCGLFGQLGIGQCLTVCSRPTLVRSLCDRFIVQVCTGCFHSLFLDDMGIVLACGDNRLGHLGDARDEFADIPRVVPGLESYFVVSVVTGQFVSLAVTAEGRLWSWGSQFLVGRQGKSIEVGEIILPEGSGKVVAAGSGPESAGCICDTGRVFQWIPFGRLERVPIPGRARGISHLGIFDRGMW